MAVGELFHVSGKKKITLMLKMFSLHLKDTYYYFFLKDADILATHYPTSCQVAYILSLGVVDEFRRHGIGKFNFGNHDFTHNENYFQFHFLKTLLMTCEE